MSALKQPRLLDALQSSGLICEFIARCEAGESDAVLMAWCRSHPLLRDSWFPVSLRHLKVTLGLTGAHGGKRPSGKMFLGVRGGTAFYKGGAA